jgi:hypothetical protein
MRNKISTNRTTCRWMMMDDDFVLYDVWGATRPFREVEAGTRPGRAALLPFPAVTDAAFHPKLYRCRGLQPSDRGRARDVRRRRPVRRHAARPPAARAQRDVACHAVRFMERYGERWRNTEKYDDI